MDRSQFVTTSGERQEMEGLKALIPMEWIERAILSIRGEKVMLDIDLAAIYDVTTKRLNEQVKRNLTRFPPDFMFQLTTAEKAEVVANCDHLIRLRFSSHLPYAFTEHGALMLANVLNSERAAQTSVMVVRVPPRRDAAAADAVRRVASSDLRVAFCLREIRAPVLAGRDQPVQPSPVFPRKSIDIDQRLPQTLNNLCHLGKSYALPKSSS